MDCTVTLKNGKMFGFDVTVGTLEDIQKTLRISKFIKIGSVLINVDEISYIERK